MDRQILVASLLMVLVAGSGVVSAGDDDEQVLRKEITIHADLDEVWRAWTTEDGLAPVAGRSYVELRIGGSYEWVP